MKPKKEPWDDQHLTDEEREEYEAIEREDLGPPASPERIAEAQAALDEAAEKYGTGRGGARPGAGRPPKEAVSTLLHLAPEARAALERRADRAGKSLTGAAEDLLLSADEDQEG